MKLPQFSVRRPVFTTMITLIVVLLGIFSLSRLQIDMLPNIELPTLTVRTQYEGASPVVMERLVTQIVEEKDATKEQRSINEINTGTYLFDAKFVFSALKNLKTDNAQGEYYLTDVAAALRRSGAEPWAPAVDTSETEGS